MWVRLIVPMSPTANAAGAGMTEKSRPLSAAYNVSFSDSYWQYLGGDVKRGSKKIGSLYMTVVKL